MPRFARLVVALFLAFTLGLGAIAHACEGPEGDRDAACAPLATAAHFDGDADQTAQDAAKAYPHHHAECHCHLPGVPLAAGPAAPARALRAPWPPAAEAAGAPAFAAPDPRPPRA